MAWAEARSLSNRSFSRSSSGGVLSASESVAFTRWQIPTGAGMPEPVESSEHPSSPGAEEAPSAEELDSIREEARKTGYAEGLVEGRRAACDEVRRQATALQRVLDSLAQPLADMDHIVESQLVELAREIGTNLFRRELAAAPEQIVELAREAIRSLPFGAETVTVYLNPADAQILAEHGGDAVGDCEVVQDATIEVGGCRVRTANSELDATVEGRASAVREILDGLDA